MTKQLQLYVCEHFRADTKAVLASDNFSDVAPTFFPSRCGRPMPADKQLSALSLFDKKKHNDKIFCSCSCLSSPDKDYLDKKNIKQLHLVNCFQMFAPRAFIEELLSAGAYIITPDWLTKWKVWVKQWGDKEQVRQMFAESVTKLVLLDTGVCKDSSENLMNFSAYINRPAETINIGLDYYQLYLENEILKWRLDRENKAAENNNSKTTNSESDYAMALDLLSNLPRAEKEEEVANRIMDIFVMLFAANKVSYYAIVDGKIINYWSIPPNSENNQTKEQLSKCNHPIKLSESGNGFCMSIGKDNQVFAVIEVGEIAFPENITKYQNLALAIKEVLAISIENSRYFQDIFEMNDSLSALNATKDKLFSIIAHDLRAPFNHILGCSELLNENLYTSKNEEAKNYVNIINSTAGDTLVLLDNLLNWAKSQTGQFFSKPEKIDLSSVIQNIIDVFASTSKIKNISLNYIQTDDAEVYADENMLKTVFRNLVSNSIKFTKIGGHINISTITNNEHVEITVSDNGVGMDSETQNKLFDPSKNVSLKGTANEKGSGLGLLLCKDFIEKLGGNIWVESQLGKGTNFKFTLPLYVEHP